MHEGTNDGDCCTGKEGTYCTLYLPVFYTLKQTNQQATTAPCTETTCSVHRRGEEDVHGTGRLTTAPRDGGRATWAEPSEAPQLSGGRQMPHRISRDDVHNGTQSLPTTKSGGPLVNVRGWRCTGQREQAGRKGPHWSVQGAPHQ